jgi:IS5 family transposase
VTKKKNKRQYRIRNWPDYNKALVRRGSLTLWIDEQARRSWLNTARTGRRGTPQTYAEAAIVCTLTFSAIYHLPLRATTGLVISLFELLGVELKVPHYSTLSRRRSSLSLELPRRASERALHLMVDSTGLKVYGEGEWKVRQYGWGKRRTWRKLHLGVDETTGEVVAAALTTNASKDGAVLPELLAQVKDSLWQVTGDGGYDHRSCYEAISRREARAIIPPRRGARIWQHGNSKQERLQRDENLRGIRQVGRAAWKRESGYHRRSLAETQMFRLKTIFGSRLSGRGLAAQVSEMMVRCAALNRMTHLGMPDSYALEQ